MWEMISGEDDGSDMGKGDSQKGMGDGWYQGEVGIGMGSGDGE